MPVPAATLPPDSRLGSRVEDDLYMAACSQAISSFRGAESGTIRSFDALFASDTGSSKQAEKVSCRLPTLSGVAPDKAVVLGGDR